jgi:exopolyphosphatase/guanosine-5'-triphosphate,3'-diphosphate pyrophosphatase
MAPPGRYGCIDIGSNTTRLLVAEAGEGDLRELCQRRVFNALGAGRAPESEIPEAKLAELAEVVAAQAAQARELGAQRVRAVATAAIRRAANRDALVAAIRGACGVEIRVLSADEEARLAFAGATARLPERVPGDVAVADVGGGSCELAVGTLAGGVRWSATFPIGSAVLADAHLRSDPPAPAEVDAARAAAEAALAGLRLDPPELALAVGGSAASLRRLLGPRIDAAGAERAIALLCSAPVAQAAARHGLAPERVRLLPAGLVVLAELTQRLGRPLEIAAGGLREGVVLELAAANGRPVGAR